jgi:hypothetical protein
MSTAKVGVGLGDDDRLEAGLGERRELIGDQRPPGEFRGRLRATESASTAAGQDDGERALLGSFLSSSHLAILAAPG